MRPVPALLGAVAAAALAAAAPAISAQTSPTPAAPAGRVEELRVPSRIYGRERRVWVYTPPGYSPAATAGYDLLVAFDGEEYLSEIPLPAILDALLADRKAPPFVAVLIDDASSAARLDDLANHARFAEFVADEVVPWARQRWSVTRDPHRSVLTGSSAGGLAAAYIAWKRPDVFGIVLAQSGAFWRGNEGSNDRPYEWLTSQYASSPRKDIRFLLEVGSGESRGALGGAAPSILDANRRLHAVLVKKGYAVTYAEVPDGVHSPETWRQRLPAALAALASLEAKPASP